MVNIINYVSTKTVVWVNDGKTWINTIRWLIIGLCTFQPSYSVMQLNHHHIIPKNLNSVATNSRQASIVLAPTNVLCVQLHQPFIPGPSSKHTLVVRPMQEWTCNNIEIDRQIEDMQKIRVYSWSGLWCFPRIATKPKKSKNHNSWSMVEG